MTPDQREQRRINRDLFPDDVKGKAALLCIGVLMASIFYACVSTSGVS